MEDDRSALKMLTGKSSENTFRRKWEGNIRMDLKEIAVSVSNWVGSWIIGES